MNPFLFSITVKEALNGDESAKSSLYDLYKTGQKVGAGFIFLEIAANEGNEFAYYWVGRISKDGRGSEGVNYAKAIYWLEKASALGNAEAEYFLGTIYDDENAAYYDKDKASEWYAKAFANGYCKVNAFDTVVSPRMDGMDVYFGLEGEDLEKVLSLWENDDYSTLGKMYLNGEIVKQNINKGLDCLEKAAYKNHDKTVGDLYYFGDCDGILKNLVLAYKWYSVAHCWNKNESDREVILIQLERVKSEMTAEQLESARRITSDYLRDMR